MNKKGIEFSVGMIVMIIISILIFALSIYFTFKWFGQAEELRAQIDQQTQEQIMTALKTGNQLVSVPITLKTTKKGQPATYGIGIKNIGDTKQFSMTTEFSNAYTSDGKTIPVSPQYIKQNWIGNINNAQFTLQRNQEQIQPIQIKANPYTAPNTQTIPGDYTFNICVYDTQQTPSCDGQTYKQNPQAYYTGRIYQVTVRVV